MTNGIVYLKGNGRMPVRLQPVIYARDVQQDIPADWCIVCRRELYEPGQRLCRRCKGVTRNERSKPLCELQPGKGSGKL